MFGRYIFSALFCWRKHSKVHSGFLVIQGGSHEGDGWRKEGEEVVRGDWATRNEMRSTTIRKGARIFVVSLELVCAI